MKKLLISILAMLLCALAIAQNETDALRYSFYIPNGTARANGMAGSFGALGADPSVIGFNPASMGVYKTTQISFSPSFKINNTESSYLGTKNRDFSANYFDINEASFVQGISCKEEENLGLSYFVWGVSYNKLNKFSENISINGINDNGSLTDWFASRANGINYPALGDSDPFYSHLAWETYLIDPAVDTITDQYVSAYDHYGEKQSQRLTKKGSLGEYNIAIAFNFRHKVYVGMDLGIQSVNYKQTIISYEERENVTNGPKTFTFEDYVSSRGSGVNFKFGILYSPIEMIRVGASIHTPTSINMKDRYTTSCATQLGDSTMTYQSPEGEFEYNVLSPLRANASICVIPNEHILVNLDYDLANYNSIKMRSEDYDFATETQNIINNYKVGHCLKLGAEYRLGALNMRVGGAYYTSPYKSSSPNSNSNTWLVSAGLGFRTNYFFFDIAYSYLQNSYVYYMYEGLVTSDPSKIKFNRNQISFTIGCKF
ncbi:MAG: outer membrane protein transport protein [Bacteroidales bacterium]|nr:outer membrane protein transport protein [Bacteroidales bacterium]